MGAEPQQPWPKVQRPAEVIVVLAIAFIVAGAVGGLVVNAVIHNDDVASSTLGLIATGGVSMLGGYIGAKAVVSSSSSNADAQRPAPGGGGPQAGGTPPPA